MNATAIAALTFAVLTATVSEASAASRAVKMACAGDYFSYCSDHAPGSSGVHSCFRANGNKLSKGCVRALVKAGMVSQSEVSRRAASLGR
ncbi:MAG: hypothetical protein KJ622_15990 [Alphaproteobacteria bacterium]|nr:hypothetical protein [Alphaproteobacteria bacterium]